MNLVKVKTLGWITVPRAQLDMPCVCSYLPSGLVAWFVYPSVYAMSSPHYVSWCVAARAMLMKADIMLLDEPTNHLDVKNVAWLEDYLTHLPDVTSMVVSHDSGFLDHVCTGIIHYENRKLKHYRVSTCCLCSVLAPIPHMNGKHHRLSLVCMLSGMSVVMRSLVDRVD